MTELITAIVLLFSATCYLAGARHSPAIGLWQLAAFASGCGIVAVALLSPLHDWAEVKLWAHMLQHELLMLIAAPLIALGRPDSALLALVRRKPLQRAAARWMRLLRIGIGPAWILHGAAVWIWHLPVLYSAAAVQPALHLAQHVSFLMTALIAWWVVLGRRAQYGAAALYVFATSLHTSLLGVLLFLAREPWYPTYAKSAGALEDQQFAGLIMWVPGGVLLAVSALWLLALWLKETERRVSARERLNHRRHASRAPIGTALVLFGCFLTMGCSDPRPVAITLAGGSPQKGKQAIGKYGCWTCHTIPGIAGADGGRPAP